MPTMPSEGSLSGGKLVVISNRGPAELIRADDTSVVSRRARGGLASSLALMLSGSGATWICAAMGPAEREISASGEVPASHEGIELQMLLVDESDYAMAYQVVSNGILWFTYHDLFDKVRRPHFDRRFLDAWDAYIRVNRLFAQEAASKAAGGATVLVQDYHFHLVGKFLKELRPDLSVVHFVHTPFCEPGVLGVLPDKVARELLTSMSAYDACGFHSDRWRSAFLACCAAYGVAAPSTFSSPLGVDERPLLETSRSTECINEAKRLATACGDRKLVVRVDRVELSKNIVRGFLAFDRMLELHPEFVGDVTFLALAYPSRESMAEYRTYRSEIETVAARVSTRWSAEYSGSVAPGVQPISPFAASLSFAEDNPDIWHPIILEVEDYYPRSVAAMSLYDVLLVNPVKDGLNLVAKEGPLVNQRNGGIVLSRNAGVWDELRDSATGTNPFDIEETAEAMASILTATNRWRKEHSVSLASLALKSAPLDWLNAQLMITRENPKDETQP